MFVVVVVVFYRKNKIEKWVCREGKGGRVVWGLVLLKVLKLVASFLFLLFDTPSHYKI